MINDEADEIIKELLNSLINRYQINLESIKSSEFVSDYVNSFYYKCHKIYLNSGGSYIDSPNWIKNKKATTNSIKKKMSSNFNTL